MAGKGKNQKKNQRGVRGRRRFAAPAVLLAAVLVCGFFGWMHMNASVVRMRYADVYLEDLPAQFDGTAMLFVSDLNIRSEREERQCERLMDKLAALQPDILLLGGDYCTPGLLGMVNGQKTGDSEQAARFLRSLTDFPAPLGKFAVTGEQDQEEMLEPEIQYSGVQLLTDSCAVVEKGGAQLVIAGIDGKSDAHTRFEEIGAHFSREDCVVVLAHNPAAYTGVRVAEARDGGAWADMVLSGHTLGGQIRLLNRTLLELAPQEERNASGWNYGNDLPLLVSEGLGCRGARLRLGTRSEVWLITLRRPGTQQKYDLPLF